MTISRRALLRTTAAAMAVGAAKTGSARAQAAHSRPVAAPGRPLVVFAAASLTEAMTAIAGLWAARGHAAPRLSFASSAVLARQIEQGADADLFLSADETWMDRLAKAGKLRPDTRVDLLGNALVLVEPAASLKPVTIDRTLDLPALLGAGGRLAVGDPASVPAGIYARQALTALGLWPAVSNRLAPAENVRAALLLVERGEVPAGIVYATDARAAPGIAVAGIFPESSHPPILYPAAVVSDAPEATAFLAFLRTDAVLAAFRAHGFRVPV